MPNRTAMALAVFVSLFVGVAASLHAQSDGGAKKVDPRLTKALEEIGFKYTVTSLGNCRLEFNLDEDRGQVVFISSRTEPFDQLETRRIWSTVSKSKEPPSREVMSKLLMDNLKQKLGAFELGELDGGGYKISYSAKVEADCPASSLRAAIRLVLHSADDKERELTGKDEF